MVKNVMKKIGTILAAMLMCMQFGGVNAAEMNNVALGKAITYSAPKGILASCEAENLIDGDMDSMSYFNPGYTPDVWLKIDLGKLYRLSEIKIAARTDSYYAPETADIEIFASVSDVDISEMTKLGVTPSEGIGGQGEVFTLSVDDDTQYGYVAIRKSDSVAMAFAELMVMTDDEGTISSRNVALGKIISATSDGNTLPGYGAENIIGIGDMYMVGQAGARWVKIDLMNYYEIDEIEVVSSMIGDGGPEWQKADVYVSYDDVDIDNMTYVGGAPENFTAGGSSYKVTPQQGEKYRYVAVRRHDTVSYAMFILSEVKVMSKTVPTGFVKQNVALNKAVTSQGSYYAPAADPTGYSPITVNDGNSLTTLFMTSAGWVKIDLGSAVAISDISINTGNCFEGTSADNQCCEIYGSLENVDVSAMTLLGTTPSNIAPFSEYKIYTAENEIPKYRYILINHPNSSRFFIGEVKVFAEISENFGAIEFSNNTPSVGESLKATVNVSNFDVENPTKQVIFIVAAYDENSNLTRISSSRMNVKLGQNVLEKSITVPENTATVKGFLIRSLKDTRMLSEMTAVSVTAE